MTESLSQYTGDWQGFAPLAGQPARVIFKIRENNGDLSILIDTPDSGGIDQEMKEVILTENRLQGTLQNGVMVFEGIFHRDGLLVGQVMNDQVTIPIELRRNNPEFIRFEKPRLDGNVEVTVYNYDLPVRLEDGLNVANISQVSLDRAPLHDLMSAILAGSYPQTHSILIARRGRLVLEEYFYGHTRSQLHTIQSITKSITSILFGIAIQRGEIEGVDQPVYSFFPERAESRWVKNLYPLTLWHALTMTAALDWEEKLPYTDPRNDNTAMNRSGDWIGYVLDREINGTPGEKYAYTSGLSILLGGILKNTTGLYADEYAQKYLFAPLGITRHTWFSAADGTRHTGGGLSLLARDLLKIGMMMNAGGRWQGAQIVPTTWVEESTRRQTAPQDYGYGYQWHLRRIEFADRALKTVCGLGYGGQCLFILPEIDLVVVFNAGLYVGDSKPFEKLEKYILPAVQS